MEQINLIDYYNINQILESIKNRKSTLKKEFALGIISESDAQTELNNMNKKERALIKKTVDKLHINKDGSPKSIKQSISNNNHVFYRTRVSRDKKISAKTIDELYLKLYAHYTSGILDQSVKSIFILALNEKKVTENPNNGTVTKYRNDFNRFISKELANTDIREINDYTIKKYTQDFVKINHPKPRVFLAYKCVLNLIFNYAVKKDIISVNPVANINNKIYMRDCDMTQNTEEDKIFSPDEIKSIETYLRERMKATMYHGYCYNAYATLFAIQTGMRAGEICSLKWSDINYNNKTIHIHTQQLEEKVKGHATTHYIANYTKDEKGISKGGRYFPLTDIIISLLNELQSIQKEKGIHSEFVFCNNDSNWLTTSAYESFVSKTCKKLNLNATNNHAFRMSLNTNVLIPLGFTAKERADMLGHSIMTNLMYYTYSSKGYVENARQKINQLYA